MKSLFGCCCGKSKQAAQFEEAFAQATAAATQQTVDMNNVIQEALLPKATKQPLTLPSLLVGSQPRAKFRIVSTEDDDIGKDDAAKTIITGTIHFQCSASNETRTCDGHTHTISGSGESADGNIHMEILRGSWSPGGSCFWMEKRTDRRRPGKKEDMVLVVHDFAHAQTHCQTVTAFCKNGTQTRHYRTFQLLIPKLTKAASGLKPAQPQSLCPSVQTVVDLTT